MPPASISACFAVGCVRYTGKWYPVEPIRSNNCCDVSWDSTCVDLYEYCNSGWTGPVSVNDITQNRIFISRKSDPKKAIFAINTNYYKKINAQEALDKFLAFVEKENIKKKLTTASSVATDDDIPVEKK